MQITHSVFFRVWSASVGCCLVLVAGCATRSIDIQTYAPNESLHYDPAFLERPFNGYENVLKFVAKNEGLPQSRAALFELAADTEVERLSFGNITLVRPDYFAGAIGGIRGAQGQGNYFAFQVSSNRWTWVGSFQASSLRWSESNGKPRVYPHWHGSATDDLSLDPSYTWNGKFFQPDP